MIDQAKIRKQLVELSNTANGLGYPAVKQTFVLLLQIFDFYFAAREVRRALKLNKRFEDQEARAWDWLIGMLERRLNLFSQLNVVVEAAAVPAKSSDSMLQTLINTVFTAIVGKGRPPENQLDKLLASARSTMGDMAGMLRQDCVPTLNSRVFPKEFTHAKTVRDKVLFLQERGFKNKSTWGNDGWALATAVLWLNDNVQSVMSKLSEGEVKGTTDKVYYLPIKYSGTLFNNAAYMGGANYNTISYHTLNFSLPAKIDFKPFLNATTAERTSEKFPEVANEIKYPAEKFVRLWASAFMSGNEEVFWKNAFGDCIEGRLTNISSKVKTTYAGALTAAQTGNIASMFCDLFSAFGVVYTQEMLEDYAKTFAGELKKLPDELTLTVIGSDEISYPGERDDWGALDVKTLDIILQDLLYKDSLGQDISEDFEYLMDELPSGNWKGLEQSIFASHLLNWLRKKLNNNAIMQIDMGMALTIISKPQAQPSKILTASRLLYDQDPNNLTLFKIRERALLAYIEFAATKIDEKYPMEYDFITKQSTIRKKLQQTLQGLNLFLARARIDDFRNNDLSKNYDEQTICAWLCFIHHFNKFKDFKQPDVCLSFNELLVVSECSNTLLNVICFMRGEHANSIFQEWCCAINARLAIQDKPLNEVEIKQYKAIVRCMIKFPDTVKGNLFQFKDKTPPEFEKILNQVFEEDVQNHTQYIAQIIQDQSYKNHTWAQHLRVKNENRTREIINSQLSNAFTQKTFSPLRSVWNQHQNLNDRCAAVKKAYARLGWWQRVRIKDELALKVVDLYSAETEAECAAILTGQWSDEAKEKAMHRLLFKDWGKKTPTTIVRMQKTWNRLEAQHLEERFNALKIDLGAEKRTWRFTFCRLSRKRLTSEVYAAIEKSKSSEQLAKRVIGFKKGFKL